MSEYKIKPITKGNKTLYRLTAPDGFTVYDHEEIEKAEYQKKQLEAFGYHLKDKELK